MQRIFLVITTLILFVSSLSVRADDRTYESLVKRELAAEDQGDVNGAIKVCMEILKLRPSDATTMNVLAGLYGTLGDFNSEINWAQKAIKSDPRHHLAYLNLGNAQFSLGMRIEAISSFYKAAELAPEDPKPIYSLGVIEEEEMHLQQAINFYEKTLRLDSKFQPGMFNLAAMYANAKRYDEAIKMLDKLLIINPQAANARQMKNQIEQENSELKTK